MKKFVIPGKECPWLNVGYGNWADTCCHPDVHTGVCPCGSFGCPVKEAGSEGITVIWETELEDSDEQ